RHAHVHDGTFQARARYAILWSGCRQAAPGHAQRTALRVAAKHRWRRGAALPQGRFPRRGIRSAAPGHGPRQSVRAEFPRDGVRLVSVTAWTGVPPGEKFRNTETWDMHGEEAGLGSIFGTGGFGLGWALPCVDAAVSALLDDLASRGLLANTLVVMVGEFGRTP